jgi:hypothetical protein
MKYFTGIIVCIILLFSCNKNAANKNVQKTDDLTKVEELASDNIDELPLNPVITAVINSDCDYYLNRSDTPSGKLKKGQDIIILDHYYSSLRDDNINIYVEVETLDKTVKGHVIETYLSYPDSLHELWFKNIPLTRSYYYTESVEYIYKKDWLPLIHEGESEEDTIKMMRWFFSPRIILVSERYFVIGEGYNVGFDTYKILSINKKDENTYLLKLISYPKKEFEIVLLVDNDSITITQIINKNEIYLVALSEHDLNIKYIPYNKEKTEKIKKDVLAWCFEQFKILGIKNDKL